MIYGSVCSGIEAASVAWEPLGWRPAFFSEIEKFPRAVLSHHYPDVPLHGDFTTIEEKTYEPIDVLVGGTPCQSFSVAGKRLGLDDPRGNLSIEYIRLARRLRPEWLVWENVPGVLSSGSGRDFGAFLGLLGEIGYGWAYRVLDAQYFGVPQRRRRVFLVGHSSGDFRRAAAVLFERESLRGNTAPSREAREGLAYSVAPSIGASGRGFERAGETRGQDPVIAVAHALRGEGLDASKDGAGRGTPLVSETAAALRCRRPGEQRRSTDYTHVIAENERVMATLDAAMDQKFGSNQWVDSEQFVYCASDGQPNAAIGRDIAPTLNSSDENPYITRSPDPIAFSSKEYAQDAGAVSPPLRAMGSTDGRPNGGGQVAVAHRMAVRRLTPIECERLQGFPDNYTQIPYRNKPADACPDGPRYKALGNSMAVPCMRWIGDRIQAASDAWK